MVVLGGTREKGQEDDGSGGGGGVCVWGGGGDQRTVTEQVALSSRRKDFTPAATLLCWLSLILDLTNVAKRTHALRTRCRGSVGACDTRVRSVLEAEQHET
jgi:hypothetical protein